MHTFIMLKWRHHFVITVYPSIKRGVKLPAVHMTCILNIRDRLYKYNTSLKISMKNAVGSELT